MALTLGLCVKTARERERERERQRQRERERERHCTYTWVSMALNSTELDGFCTEAYLSKKQAIFHQLFEYSLIFIHADTDTDTP